jgi:hypothetical protein
VRTASHSSVQACVGKIVAFKEQWLARDFGQGVRETVPKVQPGGVAAAAAEIAVRFARNHLVGDAPSDDLFLMEKQFNLL